MNAPASDPRMSVSAEEIKRYNALAATWWDPKGPMWPLHRLNALRVPFVVEAVSEHFGLKTSQAPLKGLTVLDIGCGAGLLSEAMARAGAVVTAVDPAQRNIAIAMEHAAAEDLAIEYIHGDIDSVAHRQFDVVLNMEVVEHVENLDAFMASCGACVAGGGVQIVATLNRNFKSWLFAIIGGEYVLRWLPKGTHQWRKFVTPEETRRMLTAAGLTPLKSAGVAVNPFTRSYSLTDDTSVNYMIVAARHD
ncbi:bifunctional 2-polyprenyl-6-hydroxyphenol methylase/3-demethylubiquinol 3-O-methyltransferase UbiG [Congregibacter litoralis]|uniref:Ubiquinone biosynthesis O-methyltransferase n=1 Tax=Congregibacter litoralis KT71 TaxID=314285 RepID=A4A9J2_9GAMM|nr:bifunctional 2-polyprenyl-6-hydroxyphenol methylase/3-demethylubiquinol 3-O-methyltransferase UbiG [Congregibacter litoralis]EAQ97159.2 3-demethylubiquinone-9 3-methyltransferase [Congregibacter litoralis KT71]